MKRKIIILTMLIAIILIGKSEAAILTQKLGSEYIETTVEKDEQVRMVFTSKDGFRFKNWILLEGNINIDVNSNDITFEMPNENVTIEAEYDTMYQITFNSNDETNSTTSMNIVAGRTEQLIKNTFERDGYRFTGWSTEQDNTVEYQDEADCTPSSNLMLYAVWEINEVTVEFNSNGGSEVSSITVIYGGNYGTLPIPTKSGYAFAGWYKNSNLTTQIIATAKVTDSSTHTLYAKWRIPWNTPYLGSELTPVNWDTSSKQWVTTNVQNWEYNYTIASKWNGSVGSSIYGIEGDGTAMWANAQTSDGSIYVWIPRFTYYVNDGNKRSWNADSNAGTARTYILWSNGTQDYTEDPSMSTTYTYNKHSAFCPGGKNITGFWIAKYHAARGTNNIPASAIGCVNWDLVSASDWFMYAKDLNGTNTKVGAHMTKDSEWGAVAYLTSAVGRIPYISNNGMYSGTCGSSQDAKYSNNETIYGWDDEEATRASTTHNIYGVYDMSGGVGECTAGYYSGYSDATYIWNLVDSYTKYGNKYVDCYTEDFVGDNAKLNWDSDLAESIQLDYQILTYRGGYYTNTSSAGIFYSSWHNGKNDTSMIGQRVSLWGFNW